MVELVSMEGKYVCFNGEFIIAGEPVFTARNRAFAYGDALFETIFCLGTTPRFLEQHIKRLQEGMKVMGMISMPQLNKELLREQIVKLLNKNRIFKGARVRLTVFREEGGLYTPASDNVSWIIESTALSHEKFELNASGLVIDIFDQVHKPVNALSNLKTTNALIYVLAGRYKRLQGLGECMILNQFGRVAETISSNIFIYRNEVIYTPPLTEGCIAGTMRTRVLELAAQAGYRTEEKPLFEKEIHEAEEVFITNAIQGIKWVGSYKERRYFNFVTRKLLAALNQMLTEN